MSSSAPLTRLPIVSVGVLVVRAGRVLLGCRMGAIGTGEWGLPGGKVDHGEVLEDAVIRELAEEVGPDLRVGNLRQLCIANVLKYDQQFLFIGYAADWLDGEPRLMEPNKCAGWDWHPLEAPPAGPMTMPALCLEAYRDQSAGIKYFPEVR